MPETRRQKVQCFCLAKCAEGRYWYRQTCQKHLLAMRLTLAKSPNQSPLFHTALRKTAISLGAQQAQVATSERTRGEALAWNDQMQTLTDVDRRSLNGRSLEAVKG